MNPRPKYQVFISSTFGDLHVEREAVTWAVLSARHIPVGMENFTATDDRGWKTIKSAIDRSDYYVLILAGKYGSIDSDGFSWTEKEYVYATERNIPVIAFLRTKDTITADKLDVDVGATAKLEKFKSLITKKHLCVDWSHKDDLVAKVTTASQNHILDDEDGGHPRPGWYRGNEIPGSLTLDEFARLSTENARLHESINALGHSTNDFQALVLIDRDELPFTSVKPEIRTLRTYGLGVSLEQTIEKFPDKRYLLVNVTKSLQLGIQNVSTALVEHIIVDITLNSILGFKCGWEGGTLKDRGGHLTDASIDSVHREKFPSSIRLISSKCVKIRFRISRVPIGGTEFIPDILVLGFVERQCSHFSLRYRISGSIGKPVEGSEIIRIEFDETEILTSEKLAQLTQELVSKHAINDLRHLLL